MKESNFFFFDRRTGLPRTQIKTQLHADYQTDEPDSTLSRHKALVISSR